MKKSVSAALLVSVLVCGVSGQAQRVIQPAQPAQPQPPQLTVNTQRLNQSIAIQERKVQALVQEIVALDKERENKVNQAVQMMASFTDSLDSKNRIAQVKLDAINGLSNSLNQYQQRRNQIIHELNSPYPRYSRDQLDKLNQTIDQKITERVDQLATLGDSLYQHQEYDKYIVQQNIYRNGWSDWTQRKNPAYTANRQQNFRADKGRDSIIAVLEGEMRFLEKRNQDLRAQASRTTSPEARNAAQEEIARNQETIAGYQERINNLIAPASPPDARQVGTTKNAKDIEMQIRAVVQEIQWNANEIKTKTFQLKNELTQLNRLRQISAQTGTGAGG